MSEKEVKEKLLLDLQRHCDNYGKRFANLADAYDNELITAIAELHTVIENRLKEIAWEEYAAAKDS